MGQKTHPYGFRLGVIKTWTSKWYEDARYVTWLHEDLRIKRAVKDYLYNAKFDLDGTRVSEEKQHDIRITGGIRLPFLGF